MRARGVGLLVVSVLAIFAAARGAVAQEASVDTRAEAEERAESGPTRAPDEARGRRDDSAPWGTSDPESERADRPFAPSPGPDTRQGVEVEVDLVTANAEAERARVLDAQRDEAVREAQIEAARREAPFDLAWGLDPT